MTATTGTVTVRLLHNSSIPGARWCDPVGWEPANAIEGAELVDGSWWNDDGEVAGLVWFGDRSECGASEVIEVRLEDLRVASCGNCRVIGEVLLETTDDEVPADCELPTKTFHTVRELRNWVDAHTDHWDGRTDDDLDTLVDAILDQPGCPLWKEDWRAFLDSLDLDALLAGYEGD